MGLPPCWTHNVLVHWESMTHPPRFRWTNFMQNSRPATILTPLARGKIVPPSFPAATASRSTGRISNFIGVLENLRPSWRGIVAQVTAEYWARAAFLESPSQRSHFDNSRSATRRLNRSGLRAVGVSPAVKHPECPDPITFSRTGRQQAAKLVKSVKAEPTRILSTLADDLHGWI